MSKMNDNNSGLKHNSKLSEVADVTQSLGTESTFSLGDGQVMGPLATKIESNENLQQEKTYFGIHIPNETQLIEDNALHVYDDKTEALKIVKRYKKARFKAFKSQQEAVEFAIHGCEVSTATSPTSAVPETFDIGCPVVGEKPSLFKGPKAQDLVQLRKAIECGNLQTVSTTVWNNPRYLVSSGDTPAILQEGSRYNALHVSAKARNKAMCEFIIQTIGNPEFVSLLYGDEDQESCQERAAILLDLYLNTPDKGLNETPLHFAVKFGAVGVVEALVSCSQCDREPKNKFGQTPRDIVCTRTSGSDLNLKREILTLLEEQFYVPVLRSEDNSLQPTVGAPFSPASPPALNTDPIRPRMEIHAYAGPMGHEEAVVFRKKWKTPPRMGRCGTPPNIWLQDTEKGLERVGRDLAQEFKVSWKEYWPFLGIFVDLSSHEGLQKLEVYLKNRFLQVYDQSPPNERVSSSDHLNKKQDTTSSVIADGTLSPMSDLCVAFNAISLSDSNSGDSGTVRTPFVAKRNTKNAINDIQRGDSWDSVENENLIQVLSNPGLSPFLYVEKSCQVFAKRITDSLIHVVEMARDLQSCESVFDVLLAEIKHLQVLVNSYRDDPRFVSVDFHLIHSRISSVVAYKLNKLSADDIESYICGLRSALLPRKVQDLGSSDEDDSISPKSMYRSHKYADKQKRVDMLSECQVKCVAQLTLSALLNLLQKSSDGHNSDLGGRVDSEEECMRVWSDAINCKCLLQSQSFVRNTRKGSSFKRSHNKYSVADDVVRASLDYVARRLSIGSSSGSESCEGQGDRFETDHSTHTGERSVRSHPASRQSDNISDSEDEEIFYTPPSSPDDSSSDEDMITPDEGIGVYIEGENPSKMDLSVMQALDGCHITPDEYPSLYRWRHLVLLHSEQERNSWATPASLRRQQRARMQSVNNPREPTSPYAWHRNAGRYTPATS